MLDPETRRAILARVEAALDRIDAAAEPPAGIAPELLDEGAPPPDLYSLLAQMTTLTREVQLQGRAANRMSAEVAQLVQQVASLTEGQIATRVAAARRDAQADLLGELVEVRDRFARARDEARRRLDSFRGLFTRLGSRPVVEALLRGNELALERLDETLRRHGVHEILCEGQPFDPATMRAVETEVRPGIAPGIVTDVIRRGYRSADRILRYAEVRITSGDTRS
jgi:molecular chaperone GrpE (heat shock protein)